MPSTIISAIHDWLSPICTKYGFGCNIAGSTVTITATFSRAAYGLKAIYQVGMIRQCGDTLTLTKCYPHSAYHYVNEHYELADKLAFDNFIRDISLLLKNYNEPGRSKVDIALVQVQWLT